jgi:hypothetical protein
MPIHVDGRAYVCVCVCVCVLQWCINVTNRPWRGRVQVCMRKNSLHGYTTRIHVSAYNNSVLVCARGRVCVCLCIRPFIRACVRMNVCVCGCEIW